MKGKVLILDRVHDRFKEILPELGFQIEEEYFASQEEINWSAYSGLVLRSRMPMDSKLLEQATQLKFIARVGAGLENIDLDRARELGIKVLAAPEGNRHAVGEHALGMLLALNHRLIIADSEVRKGMWLREENRGFELKGKTVGIIGYGAMGSAFASKLRGLDCRVIAYDKYKKGYGNSQVEECSLAELQAEADIISIHLPQNTETLFFVDQDFLAACKKQIVLINTARGKIVRIAAVVEALKSEKLRGACLDVLEYEKSSFENLVQEGSTDDFEYLLQSNKVILSPHIAGWTFESQERMAEVLLQKIAKLNL
ncbi:NAD(P)-dependent oxidoreductase [Croceimicrobium sp.]|uniref:NAD(P)-dependent oxidoreductase n=1 Tax=Croceimicrobium sp. TaxID=2828340 RepID=UPI003BAB2C55